MTNGQGVTPSMRVWCVYVAEGGTIYRSSATSGYRAYREGEGGKPLTYAMGLQLERAGLIAFQRDSGTTLMREKAELTPAGKTIAAEERKRGDTRRGAYRRRA